MDKRILEAASDKYGSYIMPFLWCRLDTEEGLDPDSATDLTHLLDDGCIYWDIPDGVWRVCILINTFPSHSHNRWERQPSCG